MRDREIAVIWMYVGMHGKQYNLNHSLFGAVSIASLATSLARQIKRQLWACVPNVSWYTAQDSHTLDSRW